MPRIDPEERQFALRLGAVIAKVRLENDVTQEELAEAAGVSVATIGRCGCLSSARLNGS